MNNFDPNQREIIVDGGLNKFLAKMYGFMAGAVAVSALVAYLATAVFQTQFMTFFAMNRWALWGLFILQIVLVFGMSFKADRSPIATATMLFIYAALEGIFFGILVQAYTAQNITMAFVAAAADFVVLAFLGTNTKKDLSGIGRQAMAALIALIVVSVINLFLGSTVIQFFFSFIGVLIFSVLTAWDSQRFKQMYLQYGNSLNPTNLALMGALQLYLDFINLFIQLLNIFTGLNGRD
ncbi:Bax inhibitor-1/YccA family protein [Ligilactobacillus equi]